MVPSQGCRAEEHSARCCSLPLSNCARRGSSAEPGCSLRALARTLSADPMNVKHCVDELERRRLIQSSEDPTDRRRQTLTATDAGQALCVQVNVLAQKQQVSLDGMLSPSQRDGLKSALAGLERALGLTADSPCSPKAEPATLDHDRPSGPKPRLGALAVTARQEQ